MLVEYTTHTREHYRFAQCLYSVTRITHNIEISSEYHRQRAATLNRRGDVEDPTRGTRLTIYARLERDSRTESVEEHFRARSGTRDSNSYFFFPLSPLRESDSAVFWTSSRSRRILTGREKRDADAENWTTVKPRPVPRDRVERRRGEGSWTGDAGRWHGMCRG